MKNIYAMCIVFGVAVLVMLVPVKADGSAVCCHTDDGSCKPASCPMYCDGPHVCANHSYCSGMSSLCRLPNDECAWVDEICWIPLECVYDKTCLFELQPTPTPEKPQNVCWADEAQSVCWADDDNEGIDD
jgi:hypothetical protein